MGDGHQVAGIGCNYVALLHGDAAGAAVNGRSDGGVAHLHRGRIHGRFGRHDLGAGALDGGFVGEHGLGKRIGAGLHLVRLLARDHALIEQSAIACGLVLGVLFIGDVARQVGLRLAQCRCIARQVGLRLAELGLERTRIDSKEQIALLDGVAFMEGDFGQLAAHLRLHRNGGVSLHVSDDIHIDGDIALGHLCDYHGNGPAIAGPAAGASACFRTRIATGAKGQQEGERQGCQSQLRKCFASVHENCHANPGRLHTESKNRRPLSPEGYRANVNIYKYTCILRGAWGPGVLPGSLSDAVERC